MDPILFQHALDSIGSYTGHVIHDGKDSSFHFSCFLDAITNLISLVPNAFITTFQIALAGKPLQKDAIYTVLCHPVEMPCHQSQISAVQYTRRIPLYSPWVPR
jgi:hypothetical protein